MRTWQWRRLRSLGGRPFHFSFQFWILLAELQQTALENAALWQVVMVAFDFILTSTFSQRKLWPKKDAKRVLRLSLSASVWMALMAIADKWYRGHRLCHSVSTKASEPNEKYRSAENWNRAERNSCNYPNKGTRFLCLRRHRRLWRSLRGPSVAQFSLGIPQASEININPLKEYELA